MQAAVRTLDRAILAVGEHLAPRDGATIVEMTPFQQAHWGALTIPPGEVMALYENGEIGVLTYGLAVDVTAEELQSVIAAHPDLPLAALFQRAGLK